MMAKESNGLSLGKKIALAIAFFGGWAVLSVVVGYAAGWWTR